MPLAHSTSGRIAFDKAAIMRRAHAEGRFALRMCRTIAERRRQLSLWLRKAWVLAKREASDLRRHAEEAASRRTLATRAAEAVALVASHGGAEGIRQEIEAEHYR